MAVEHENNANSLAGDELPDWLRQIRGDPPTSKSTVSDQPGPSTDIASSEADISGAQDDLPSWLQDVRGKEQPAKTLEPVEPVEPIVESSEATEVANDDADDDDDWQRLLAEEGIELDDLAEDRPEGAEDMSVRDWIAATSVDSPLARSRQIAESLAAAQPIEAESTGEEAPAASEDLPAWLREDKPTTVESGTSSWLTDESILADTDAVELVTEADTASSEVSDEDDIIADELPSWLQEERSTPTESEPASWLTDESGFNDMEMEEAAQIEAEVPESLIDDAVADELPSWLQEERSATSESGTASWLADETSLDETDGGFDIADVAEDVIEPIVSTVTEERDEDGDLGDEDDMPDWLRDDEPADLDADTVSWLTDEASLDDASILDQAVSLESVEPDKVTTSTNTDLDMNIVAEDAQDIAPESDGLVIEDELPDWLREDTIAEGDAETPSWLADEATYEDDISDSLEAATSQIDVFDDVANVDDILADASNINVDPTDEDVPDWLEAAREIDAEPLFDTSATFDEELDDAFVDDGMVDEDGLPDWLRDEEVGTSDVEAAISDALPNWVSDTSDDNGVAQEGDVLDAFAARGDDQDSDSAGSQSPPWLEKLRESDDVDTTEVVDVPVLAEHAVSDIEDNVDAKPIVDEAQPKLPEAVTARLSVAKATLEAGDLDEALTIFQDLVAESQALDEVIVTLTDNLENYQKEPTIYETLADAQVRQGLLSQALETYQIALHKL